MGGLTARDMKASFLIPWHTAMVSFLQQVAIDMRASGCRIGLVDTASTRTWMGATMRVSGCKTRNPALASSNGLTVRDMKEPSSKAVSTELAAMSQVPGSCT